MNIGRVQNLSALFSKSQSSSSPQFERRNERADEMIEEARKRREARRAARTSEPDPIVTTEPVSEPGDTPLPSSSTPSQEPSSTKSELSLDDLAELYVKQYEEGAGVTLSSEAFEQKKSEVSSFYSQLSNGQERLDKIVFANDGTNSSIVA
ncbi:MAG: hypothetical protein KDD60_13075 [Bdellovibrionales bacterium]|nr:hypothetical protein [Bdellovibrionales bacterium]